MSIHYLETGSLDPALNLAFEEHVLKTRLQGDFLMLWQNDNTVVVGLNQNTIEEIDPDFVAVHGITVIRRNTGGGAVYHDLGNLNYSFISDLGVASELSIARFTEPVCAALRAMGVEASASGRNDIVIDGKKVSGVAQRVLGGRILHHGTLLFDSSPDMIAGALRADPQKFSSKSAKSVRSRVTNIRAALPQPMSMEKFKESLLASLAAEGLIRETLTDAELIEVRELAEKKYRSYEWNYGRSPASSLVCRRRFKGGTLEARINIENGVISDALFLGDFMATEPCDDAALALIGLPYERNAVEKALFDVYRPQMFGGIGLLEISGLIFGNSEAEHG